MKFNPQILMQMMLQRNPGLMQQFHQFQQAMQNNPQMLQQYRTFRSNLINNPNMQEQAFQEAINKIGGQGGPTPPINNG